MQLGTARVIGTTRRRPFRIWHSRGQCFTEVALFAVGASGSYSVSVVGMLPGNEILLLPLLVGFLFMHGARAFRREYLWFYVLALAWLFGTIAGDVYLGTPRAQSLKGIARVVFFVVDFIGLAIMTNKSSRRMVIFLLSIFVQMILIMRYFRGDFLIQWKFGGSSIVTITALLFACRWYSQKRYGLYFLVVLGIASLNLIFAFRSQIVTDFLSLILVLPILSQTRPRTQRGFSFDDFLKFSTLVVLSGAAVFLSNRAIIFAANLGLFDESNTAKFQMQANGKFGVLVGGRPETLVAIQAIRDSPIIGHGSFAVDPKYLELMQRLQYDLGYSDTDTPQDPDEPAAIPTHSHLTSAWVESGIFGGIFWIYALLLTLRGLMKVSVTRPPLAPLYSYLLLNFIWNILYSPFGSVNRMWAAFFILMSFNLLSSDTVKATGMNKIKSFSHAAQPPFRRIRPGMVG
jgi:energy-converting hydrogenase Eha subunit A